jgi:gamma-glutamyltranspeptidase
MATGGGTRADPWVLKTPPGTSDYTMYVDDAGDPPAIVCQVGSTTLKYDRRAIDDTVAMLKAYGDWMDLGAADEQKDAKPGTVEAWGRDPSNPVGGWYGLRKGYRGRFGMYMPPLLEALGLVELTHDAKGNKMRAKG